MKELKPCPFCGGRAILNIIGNKYYVDCNAKIGECPCIPKTFDFDVAEDAIEAWNRRAEE